MGDSETLLLRITHLEERLAHNQHLIQQLNEVIVQLRMEMDAQQSVHRKKLAELKDLIDRRTGDDLPHDKPPHY